MFTLRQSLQVIGIAILLLATSALNSVSSQKFTEPRLVECGERKFAKNLKQFMAELKNNPRTQRYLIRNLGMSNRPFKEALRQLRNEKVRFQMLRKRSYRSYYPEFMTVTITE